MDAGREAVAAEARDGDDDEDVLCRIRDADDRAPVDARDPREIDEILD